MAIQDYILGGIGSAPGKIGWFFSRGIGLMSGAASTVYASIFGARRRQRQK